MFKQTVNIIEFSELYNILIEIKNLFTFELHNYKEYSEFVGQIEVGNPKSINSIIIVKNKNHTAFLNKKIIKKNILVLDNFPIKVEKILDKINILLIKQRYHFQSQVKINSYILNLNSKVISTNDIDLKLTEREIDIILFLNENKKPQSIDTLQNKVWGHSYALETHTVETHIYRLRKKINDKFNDNDFIISVNDGYKLLFKK